MGYVGAERREYQLRWIAARKQRGYAILGGRFVNCGSVENLEIDHIEREEKDLSLKRAGTQSVGQLRA